MAVGGVEHIAFALFAHPGPRFLLAALQNGAVVAVAVVHIGFIPGFKSLEAAHHRMLRRGDHRVEDARAVGLEPTADEFHKRIRAAETCRRAMDRQERAAILDIT